MRSLSSRPGPVSLTLTLPPEGQVVAVFFDDGSRRDLTSFVADLLLEFLLRGAATGPEAPGEQVPVMEVELVGGSWGDCVLELHDSASGARETVPGAALPGLLASAVAMAIADATATN